MVDNIETKKLESNRRDDEHAFLMSQEFPQIDLQLAASICNISRKLRKDNQYQA